MKLILKQSEVNFEVKKYFSKGEYEKDGCPVLYYEFDNHEYYGLVAVRTDLSKLGPIQKVITKSGEYRAAEIYAEVISGESVDEVLKQGYPTQVPKSYALLKFLLAPDYANRTIVEVIKEFNQVENGVLLVDGDLI